MIFQIVCLFQTLKVLNLQKFKEKYKIITFEKMELTTLQFFLINDLKRQIVLSKLVAIDLLLINSQINQLTVFHTTAYMRLN